MSVRKRTWTTGRGIKEAWIVDYVRQPAQEGHQRVFEMSRDSQTNVMLHSPGNSYTVADAATTAFEALTSNKHRDGCDRVTALQRSVDENPRAYEAYCRAMRR